MKLEFLPVSQVWVFRFGPAIVSIDGIRSFEKRRDAVKAANRVGLTVDVSNNVGVQ